MLRTPDERGLTLPELLVYSLLFVFILGIVYASLMMGLDAYRRTERFAAVQQQALQGMNAVTEELAGSPFSAVRLENDAVVFLSARTPSGGIDYDGSGRALWQQFVCFYRAQDGDSSVLVRKIQALTPTSEIPETIPSPSSMRSYSGLPSRGVAREISGLGFQAGNPVSVSVTSGTGGEVEVTLSDQVALRL